MSRNEDPDVETDLEVQSLNRVAVVGLVGSFFLALVGLFVLPAIEALGYDTEAAFWAVLAVEFVAAVGVGVSARRLYG